MNAVLQLAERHGLRVVEDAAHAPGGTYGGRSSGTLGDVGRFSFFSNKNLPIGEGGTLVTNDDALAERRLPEENAGRRRFAAGYRAALDGRAGISMPFSRDGGEETSSHRLAVALLPEGASRVDVREALTAARIQTSVHYPPIHQFSRYSELGARRPLPHTDAVAGRILTLPLYGRMADEDVEQVASALLEAL